MTQPTDERAAMQTRAETASVPSKVGGLDGPQWAAKVLADPMRTLPPGAGYLIVKYYEDEIQKVKRAGYLAV